MIDGGLRPLFHDRLRRGFHWQAIETGGTGLGIPDSNFCGFGVDRWVEYKRTEAWSVGLSAEQCSWHMKRHMAGGRTFIAVRRQNTGGPRKGPPVDELWLCGGIEAGALKMGGLKATGVNWFGVWSNGPSNWDWDKIGRILVE